MLGSFCRWPSAPQERNCACGCINHLIEYVQDLRLASIETVIVELLKRELRNRLALYTFLTIHLWRLEIGTDSPRIVALRKIAGTALGANASFEYNGRFHVELVVNLPKFVERLGLAERLTCKLTLEKIAGCILISFCDDPYPHMRFSFRRMPRFELLKRFVTPNEVEIRSRILSWIIDAAVILDIRRKSLQPRYSMKDHFRPKQWHLLQLPEAVHKQGLIIIVDIIRVTNLQPRSSCRNVFCIATAENHPWIHMDLIDLQPLCRFELVIERVTPYFPGMVTIDEENTNLALGVQGSRVIVSAVVPDGDADRARLLEQDVIIEVNGIHVRNSQHTATLLDESVSAASIKVERRVQFRWSRTHYRHLPREKSIRLSTLQESCHYSQSATTTGTNFKAMIGTPCEIIANAVSRRFQYIRTEARSAAVDINATFRVRLHPDRKYLNFGLWAALKPEPELLGYGSMHLYACLAHCLEAEGPTIVSRTQVT